MHEKISVKSISDLFEGDVFFQVDSYVVGLSAIVVVSTLNRGG